MGVLKPKFIVWHTAAHYNKRRDKTYDTTKADLHQWHVNERGWSDIGYHYLVRWDGDVVECRPLEKRGAHVAGLNHKSVGICFSGSGEHEPLKSEQLIAGLQLTQKLQKQFGIDTPNVIGHNEILDLIERGELAAKWRTSKACPGRYVDMDAVRSNLNGKHAEEPSVLCGACPYKTLT